MALRITGTSLTPEGPPSASELSSQASVLLAGGDVAGYQRLFEHASEHEDPHRRYQARIKLLEQGFTATRSAPPARTASIFTAVATAALDILAEEPREPVLLNYAGVAMYELWSLDAARVLFRSALSLDPSLPNVRGNLDELARRRKGHAHGARIRPLHADIPALARKAKRIAALAKPVTGLTLSLCMIVRDEEEMLGRCLAAVAPAVDEIVIVDTGSTDRTIEIAKSFGANVIEREWTGSFSEARNVSFEAATGDWVMYLDADEVLVSDDVEKLKALTTRTWREAFYLAETNYTGDAGDGTAVAFNALRVFRNRPEYRFEGRLHEQIAQHLPMYLAERIELSQVRIEHYGYLGSVRNAKEKSQRNISLLKAQQAENDSSPFMHFNLGSEYAAAGDAPAAASEFERAWQMLRRDPNGTRYGFASPLSVRLVRALRESGRASDAIRQASECLLAFPGLTDLVLEQAMAYLVLGRRAEAIEHYRRCIDMGDAPTGYTSTVGSGTYLPRLGLAELQLQDGELEQARELLDWCLTHYPDFFGTVVPYATVMLKTGLDPEQVVAEVERRVTSCTPTIRFMLGIALYETGLAENAERQFRLVLESQPRSAQARVALGEALLSQRRYEEAAAEAARVSDEDPLAQAARRTELFGRIASGDHENARATLARATKAGLPEAELAVFAGWSALAAGESYERRLPRTAASLLEVILEALLRVQDFKAFENLVPLLERTELPRRDQRELLAAMYLRRGFLASAAKEWMEVCEQQPDARALVGLSQVALAHGLPEDARTFAAEALKLEPTNRAASAIIAAHRPAEAA